jgi:glyoxylase-like metal-dependent hydrolase (beta-lactamase superfamily II)
MPTMSHEPQSGTAPARKQEQDDASLDVTEVAPGVLRMQLPIRFTGLGHVNMYGLVDERGVAVVDPGMPGGASWRAVADRLRRAGFGVGDVHTVVVTHSHPDHFGGAGRLAKEAGAELVAHAEFAVPWWPETGPDVADLDGEPAVEDEGSTSPERTEDRHGWSGQTPWGSGRFRPSLRQRVAMGAVGVAGRRFVVPPVPTRRLRDGEVIKLAGREWFAVHTPGHTADHLCLHDPEAGVLLAGDHVLPTITPHISGVGLGDPLDDYVAALDRVAALDHVNVALPAHGHPFADVAGRVDAVKRHHQDRLRQLAEVGAAIGPATVTQFSRHLFRRHHWGMMAESETYAHLEHLRHAGLARRSRCEGELVYEVESAGGG